MIGSYVDNGEVLYRSVRADCDEYRVDEGRLRITANAFKDSCNKPSVDRSSMRLDPRESRLGPTDGVASLVTVDVRKIGPLTIAAPGGRVSYAVDVQHRPIQQSASDVKENLAHCQIECNPDIKRNHFKKLKEALAYLASQRGWSVEPSVSD